MDSEVDSAVSLIWDRDYEKDYRPTADMNTQV